MAAPSLAQKPILLRFPAFLNIRWLRMCFERSDRQSCDSMALISSALPCLRSPPTSGVSWRYMEMMFHEFQNLSRILLFEGELRVELSTSIIFHHCLKDFDGLPKCLISWPIKFHREDPSSNQRWKPWQSKGSCKPLGCASQVVN